MDRVYASESAYLCVCVCVLLSESDTEIERDRERRVTERKARDIV